MRRLRVLVTAAFLAACSTDIAPTNPYDPETPVDRQVKGKLIGTVVGAAAFDTAKLKIEIEGATLRGGSVSEVEVAQTVEGPTIHFTAEVPAGTYRIRAEAENFEPAERFAAVPAGAAVDVGLLVLQVGRGQLKGRVVARSPLPGVGDSAPPLDTRVTLVRLVEPLAAPGTSAGCVEPGLEEVVLAPLRADGTFVQVGLAAGPYLVLAERDGYVPALSSGSVQVNVNEETDAGVLVLLVANGMIRMTPPADPDADPASPATSHFDPVVELALPPLYNGMRISEDVTFSDAGMGDAEFGPVQESLSWTFPPGEGARRLYVQFRAPTCSVSPVFAADIVIDTTPPVAHAPALKAGGACTNQALATLKLAGEDPCAAGRCAGLYQMRVASDGEIDDEPWVPYEPEKAVDLGADGEKTVAFELRDRAGNDSPPMTATLVKNSAGPAVTRVLVNGGATIVHGLNVLLSFEVAGATEVEIGNGSALDGTGWFPIPVTLQAPWRLADGEDGPRQLAVRFRDGCGNETEPTPLVVQLDRSGRIRGSARLATARDHSLTGVAALKLVGSTYTDIGKTTTTGPDGAYEIGGLGAGSYQLAFTHEGYVARSLDGLLLAEGGELLLPEIVLEVARGSLTGKATLEGEETHEGVRVEASPGVTAFTATDGRYIFPSLPVGQYLLGASKGAAYSPTTSGTLVSVVEDEEAQAPDMMLSAVPGHIFGSVELQGRTVHSGVNVLVEGVTVGGAFHTHSTTSADDGDFDVTEITAGDYDVTLTSNAFRTLHVTGKKLPAGGALDLGHLVLEPAKGGVAGRVQLAGETNHAGVRASLQQSNTERAYSFSDSAGDFAIGDVPAGDYTLTFTFAGFGIKKISSVVVQADQVTAVGTTTLTRQIGQVSVKDVTAATNLTTVQMIGSYPGAVQARFCEDPAITNPDNFTLTACPYGTVTFAGGSSTFNPVPLTFKATPCPGPSDPAAICDGQKTIWARIKDSNAQESSWFEVPVILDRKPPRGAVVIAPLDNTVSGTTLTNGGAAYTRQTTVTVVIIGTEDISSIAPGGAVSGVVTAKLYRSAADGNPLVVAMAEGAKTLQGVQLAAGTDGARNLILQVADAAGNLSVTNLTTAAAACPDPRGTALPTDCDAVFLDTTAPPALRFSVNPTDPSATGDYSVGDAFATSPLVTLGLDSSASPRKEEDEGVEAQLSNDSSFASVTVQPLGAAKTTLNWFLSPGDGVKTVYVKVRDRAGNLSLPFNDSLTLDTVTPDAPTQNPIGAYTNLKRPPLTWGTVTGADGYKVQLSTSATFSGAVTQTRVGTTYTPAADLPDAKHYWRVRSFDNANHESVWSQVDTFTVDTGLPAAPTLTALTPSTVANNRPELRWTRITDAASYEIDVDTSAAFNTSAKKSGAVVDPSWTPPQLADGTWFAQVRSVDAATNRSAYSSNISFTVDTLAPSNPTVSAPADAALLNSSNVTFAWDPLVPAPQSYILQVGPNVALTTFDETTVTGGTQKTLVLPDGSWTFRVGAVDAAGNRSDLSAAAKRTIAVDTLAPATPTPTLLATLLNTRTPTFAWAASTGASQYVLKVDGNTYTTANLTLTPTDSLADGPHSWTVAAKDAAQNQSAFAPGQSFEVDATAPPAPTITLVAPDPTNVATQNFDFAAVPDGVSYFVEWDVLPTFSSSGSSHGSSTVTTTRATVGPLADGSWNWHVRATDDAGNVGPFSATDSFALDTVVPGAPTASAPADNGFATASTVAFSWTAGTGATVYLLDVSALAGFTSYDRYEVTTTSRSVGLADADWYWRVASKDAAGNTSAATTIRKVTVDTLAPGTPVLTAVASPSNNKTPALSWGAVTGASSFDVTLDGTVVNRTTTSYTPAALADGTHTWTVVAKDAAGNKSPAAPTQSFLVDATPPANPVLNVYTPDPTPSNTPVVSWGAVAEAASYTVQWDDEPTFSNPLGGTATTASTSAAIGPLSNVTTYWRVFATDAVGNSSTPTSNDSFLVDAAAPGAPTPVGPTDNYVATAGTGTYNTGSSVTFSWASLSDAASYRLQLYSDSNLQTLANERTGIAGTSQALTLADRDYWWRVLATDAAGNGTSPASATVRKLTVDASAPATPILAAVSTPTLNPTPTFTWSNEGGSGAVSYTLTIDTTDNVVTVTSFTPSSALSNASHTVKVKSKDAAGNFSAYSPTQTFVVDNVAPNAPGSLSPAPNVVCNSAGNPCYYFVTFSWSAVTDTLSPPVSYQLQVARDNGFVSLVVSQSQSATSLSIALYEGDYWWRVKALDASGNASSYAPGAAGQKLTVDYTAPNVPILTPVGARVNTTPTLRWTDQAASGAASYTVQIDDDPNFGSVNVSASPATNSYVTSLSAGTWYWRVRAVDAASNASAYTNKDGFELDVAAPAAVATQQYPVGGDGVREDDLEFGFTEVSGSPVFYKVEVYTAGNVLAYTRTCAAVAGTPCYALGNGTVEIHPIDGFFPEATYFWRVRTEDDLGNPSAWKPAVTGAAFNTYLPSFIIDNTAPATPALVEPAEGSATNASAAVPIQWTSVTGVYAYHVFVEKFDSVNFVWTSAATDQFGTTSAAIDLTESGDGQYRAWVEAWDFAGNHSAPGAVHEFIVDTVEPSAPVVTSVDGGNRSARLFWNPSTDDRSGVKEYLIYYGQSAGPSTDFVVAAASQRDFTVTGLVNKRNYYFRIKSRDNAGNLSSYSNEFQIPVGWKRSTLPVSSIYSIRPVDLMTRGNDVYMTFMEMDQSGFSSLGNLKVAVSNDRGGTWFVRTLDDFGYERRVGEIVATDSGVVIGSVGSKLSEVNTAWGTVGAVKMWFSSDNGRTWAKTYDSTANNPGTGTNRWGWTNGGLGLSASGDRVEAVYRVASTTVNDLYDAYSNNGGASFTEGGLYFDISDSSVDAPQEIKSCSADHGHLVFWRSSSELQGIYHHFIKDDWFNLATDGNIISDPTSDSTISAQAGIVYPAFSYDVACVSRPSGPELYMTYESGGPAAKLKRRADVGSSTPWDYPVEVQYGNVQTRVWSSGDNVYVLVLSTYDGSLGLYESNDRGRFNTFKYSNPDPGGVRKAYPLLDGQGTSDLSLAFVDAQGTTLTFMGPAAGGVKVRPFTIGPGEASMTWDSVPDADRYRIDHGPTPALGTTSYTSLTSYSTAVGEYLSVRPVDRNGQPMGDGETWQLSPFTEGDVIANGDATASYGSDRSDVVAWGNNNVAVLPPYGLRESGDDGTYPFIFFSTNGGASFTKYNPYSVDMPVRAIAASNNRVHFVFRWFSSTIYASYSDGWSVLDGGPNLIDSGGGPDGVLGNHVSFGTDPASNRVLIAYSDVDQDQIGFAWSSDNGTSYTKRNKVTFGDCCAFYTIGALEVGPVNGDEATVFFRVDSTFSTNYLYYIRTTDAGVTWTSPALLTYGDGSNKLVGAGTILAASGNRAHTVQAHVTADNNLYLTVAGPRVLGSYTDDAYASKFYLDREKISADNFDLTSNRDGHYLVYKSEEPAAFSSYAKIELAFCRSQCHLVSNWVSRAVKTFTSPVSSDFIAPSVAVSNTGKVYLTYRMTSGGYKLKIQRGGTLRQDTIRRCGTSSTTDIGLSCRGIKEECGEYRDGLYWLDYSGGGGGVLRYQAQCDMTRGGGGWTMCYTTNAGIQLRSDLSVGWGPPTGSYGTNGYRATCNAAPFQDVFYMNHGSGEWLAAAQTKNAYQFANCSDTAGLCGNASHAVWNLTGVVGGVTLPDSTGSVQFCDDSSSGFRQGVHVTDQSYSTGFTACNNWSGYAGPAWRTDSQNGYAGDCWAQNSHSSCGSKVVSVGIR